MKLVLWPGENQEITVTLSNKIRPGSLRLYSLFVNLYVTKLEEVGEEK